MNIEDLNTKEQNTWCPGCPNNGIALAFKQAVVDLVNEKKVEAKDISVVTGIGCHAKIYDYVNLNAFYGIHGRSLPLAEGIKLGNPKMKVFAFSGDGDSFSEGIAHFVHACRHNPDLTLIVHNNQAFSLTTGQATPTSEMGFKGVSTPQGTTEGPLNPLKLALSAGATFVARGFALDVAHLKDLIKEASEHKGFSFIEVLQPCLIFHNPTVFFQKNVYKIDASHKTDDFKAAFDLAGQWNYSYDKDEKIPLGVFYKIKRPTFEEEKPQLKDPWYLLDRKPDWEKITREFK